MEPNIFFKCIIQRASASASEGVFCPITGIIMQDGEKPIMKHISNLMNGEEIVIIDKKPIVCKWMTNERPTRNKRNR